MVEKLLYQVFRRIHILQYFIGMMAQRPVIPGEKPFKFPDVATLNFLLYVEISKVHSDICSYFFRLFEIFLMAFSIEFSGSMIL